MATITSSTLASDWTPANPSACPSPTDYWQWDYGQGLPEDTVLGGPSQTTNGCLPTGWDGQMTYLGAQCPSSYSPACGGTSNSPITCCPTAYAFSCVSVTGFTNVMAPTFRCVSQYTSSTTAVVTHWAVQARTTDVGTRDLMSPWHLFALGILYATPAPSSSSSTPSPTPNDNPERGSDDGLSVGASVGVGVGVASGILLIAALLFWLVYRRRFSRRRPMRPPKRDVVLDAVHGGKGASTSHNKGDVNVHNTFGAARPFELP
ncbi:hypothetical protein VMCG_10249 [Cytospora schulzeri]|uniref:Mid2 domain-containing protein n=1 Tax=Cytospora schulzeri TaxID=448051 RepID=A0A423VH07_9PEZI|nr:hypothetical protein VMCG_10249 [Valsa malicola]